MRKFLVVCTILIVVVFGILTVTNTLGVQIFPDVNYLYEIVAKHLTGALACFGLAWGFSWLYKTERLSKGMGIAGVAVFVIGGVSQIILLLEFFIPGS